MWKSRKTMVSSGGDARCSNDLDLTGRELTCGQAEYPAGQNEGADAWAELFGTRNINGGWEVPNETTGNQGKMWENHRTSHRNMMKYGGFDSFDGKIIEVPSKPWNFPTLKQSKPSQKDFPISHCHQNRRGTHRWVHPSVASPTKWRNGVVCCVCLLWIMQ